MTTADLQRLSRGALDALFHTLDARVVPTGTFTGVAWIAPWAWTARLFGLVWRGKIFTPGRVVNRILGRRLIEGSVRLARPEILIDYPQLHIVDHLRPVSPRLYLGHMTVAMVRVYFTLERVNVAARSRFSGRVHIGR